jgi:hypothetical protein
MEVDLYGSDLPLLESVVEIQYRAATTTAKTTTTKTTTKTMTKHSKPHLHKAKGVS